MEATFIAETVMDIAKTYLGTTEGDWRHKDIVDQYNGVKPYPVGYKLKRTDDWCDAFVTVVGDLAGASSLIGRECSVQRHIHIFKKKGIWLGVVKPKPGDIVTFDWMKDGWSDHIGFVEKVNGNKITTIEGNTSKQVARRSYTYNDWRISGYARPKYLSNSDVATPTRDLNAVAREVIQGKWGNGEVRTKRLTEAGYNASDVPKLVNQKIQPMKTNRTIAEEVIAGKWGNGDQRKQLLNEAGYDYDEIQKLVNQLMK